MNCRDCARPFMFVGRVPWNFIVCDCGRKVPTLLHYRDAEHIKAVREHPRPRKPPGQPKVAFGAGTSREEQERLLALIAEAEKEASR